MTQAALDTYTSTDTDTIDNDEEEPADTDANGDDDHAVTIIITTDLPDLDETLDDLLGELATTRYAHPPLDELPRYDDYTGTLDVPPDPPDRVEITMRGVPVTVRIEEHDLGRDPGDVYDAVSDAIDDAVNDDTTIALTHAIGALGRDTDEIAAHVTELLTAGVEIHTPDVVLTPPMAAKAGDLIRAIGNAGYSVIPVPDDADDLINEGAVGGRPPIGFEYDDGELATSDDYHKVCKELAKRKKGKQSQRATARGIGCAPRTVRRAIEDHPDRYGL